MNTSANISCGINDEYLFTSINESLDIKLYADINESRLSLDFAASISDINRFCFSTAFDFESISLTSLIIFSKLFKVDSLISFRAIIIIESSNSNIVGTPISELGLNTNSLILGSCS